VHTIPHSEISVVDNLTKEYTYYLTDIGVAYKEDVDEVFEILESVDKEMREDDAFKDMMLEPIQIFGLDEFADSALNIKVRLKTQSHSRWPVGREFNRRVKIAFDKAGIEIPFPHRTVFMNPTEPEQSNSVNEEEKG
jgi:small conductance mechanosensitive channel